MEIENLYNVKRIEYQYWKDSEQTESIFRWCWEVCGPGLQYFAGRQFFEDQNKYAQSCAEELCRILNRASNAGRAQKTAEIRLMLQEGAKP